MDKSVPVTLPEGFVEFYEDVESWQNELFFRLKKKTDSKKVDAIPLLKREDRPLLEFLDFEVDLTEYREAFLSFAQLLKDKREKASLFVDRIMDIKDELDYGELLTRALENDKKYFSGLENETGVPASIMTMISQHAVRPFLRVFALPYEQSIREDESLGWGKGVCPVCGAMPSISRVRATDGRRFLFCEECFTEWEHRYLACVYCGNSEPSTIKYFVVDGDDANQVFVCEKCKGYLKNYDERRGKARTDLFITNIKTIYLDLLAEQRGYGRRETDFN
ncbi:MAG TPA: formate dehydrogenase accessory protein FdhE [Syntrophothermus lipocalidus]|uniref:Formate dehydrogenase accessory protein n=1 Tax=Syntrophothermus lipocalidus (strain DSM 12680 / TGB-C1) TaxID=643648 RepID=D7CNA9_SYNLT|nr:formate dehydrogenase accessory protein FdhE [Syntrophothermus lipocalidus]ADI02194.1 formate dehydrogenase accessory protein [Syntrophothermus lipocalidus DSM 12680]HHV75963.1 formate dehydrogenase accessory protein FdhE [Syntrophothermus lipocalidus]